MQSGTKYRTNGQHAFFIFVIQYFLLFLSMIDCSQKYKTTQSSALETCHSSASSFINYKHNQRH